jgi:hypothetical protein
MYEYSSPESVVLKSILKKKNESTYGKFSHNYDFTKLVKTHCLTVINDSPYSIIVIISPNYRSLMIQSYNNQTVLKYILDNNYEFSKMIVNAGDTKKIQTDSPLFYMSVAHKTSDGKYELIRDNTIRDGITKWICEENMFGRISSEHVDKI